MSRAHLGTMQEHQQSAGSSVPCDRRQLRHRQRDDEGTCQAESDSHHGLQRRTEREKCHSGDTQQNTYWRIGNHSSSLKLKIEPIALIHQIVKFYPCCSLPIFILFSNLICIRYSYLFYADSYGAGSCIFLIDQRICQ